MGYLHCLNQLFCCSVLFLDLFIHHFFYTFVLMRAIIIIIIIVIIIIIILLLFGSAFEGFFALSSLLEVVLLLSEGSGSFAY